MAVPGRRGAQFTIAVPTKDSGIGDLWSAITGSNEFGASVSALDERGETGSCSVSS